VSQKVSIFKFLLARRWHKQTDSSWPWWRSPPRLTGQVL